MTSTDIGTDAGEHAHADGDHLSDLSYIKIGLLLAVLTAIEVALFYIDVGSLEAPALLAFMVVKFAIVAAYFMHLKGDKRILTIVFVSGLVLAMAVFIAVLFAFEFF